MRRQASISRSFSSLHCIPNSQTAQLIRKRMKSLSSNPPALSSHRKRCLSLSSSSLLLMNGSFKNLKERTLNKSPERKDPDNLPSHRSTTATSTKSSSEKLDDKCTSEREKMGPSPFKSQSQPQQKFLKRAPRASHPRRKLNSSVILQMMGPEIEKYASRRSVQSTPRNKRLTSFHRHSYLNLTALKSDLHSLSLSKERQHSFTRTKHAGMTQEHSLSTPRIHLQDSIRNGRILQGSPLVKVKDYLKGTPRYIQETLRKNGRELEQLRLASKRMESVKVRHKKTLTEVKENSKTVQNSIESVLDRRIKNLNRSKQIKIEIDSVKREIEKVREFLHQLKQAADYKRKTVQKVKDFIRENTFDLHSQHETLQLLEKENFILRKLLKNAKHINDNLRAKNQATSNKLDKTKLMAQKMMDSFESTLHKSGSHPSLKQLKF